jgi:integrase/recombinase XerD
MKVDSTLTDIVQLFVENLDLKMVSIRSYQSILSGYINYLNKRAISNPKRTDIIHYRESLREMNLKAATIQKKMIVIKTFYKWLRINYKTFDLDDRFAYDIAEGLKGAKIEATYKKEPLDILQARRLIARASKDINTLLGARNYAMIVLMLVTGLRAIEVARALRTDLSSLDGNDILYIQGKGRDDKDLFVKLPNEVMSAITHYFKMRLDEDNHLFVSHAKSVHGKGVTTKTIQESIKEIMLQAGVFGPKISVHSLRHTCAYLNIKQGGSLESTQQLLRHSNIDTTLIYAHNINRVKDESEYRIAKTLFPKKAGNDSIG